MIFNKVQELKAQGLRIGFTASQFDMLHAGHVAMLSEAKNHCDYLIAGLQNNASWDRPEKNAPIQSIVERQIQLAATRYVDEIVVYNTEKDLEDILLTRTKGQDSSIWTSA
jgi:glycerol-3-phosphate cytidylyltransferase